MMSGLLVMTLLVMVPFVLASVRYVVLRSGHPHWLREVLAARAPHGGLGAGATAAEELNAFLNANKRVQLEYRQEQLVLRDEVEGSALPGWAWTSTRAQW